MSKRVAVITSLMLVICVLSVGIIEQNKEKRKNEITTITDYYYTDGTPVTDVCIAILDTGVGCADAVDADLVCFVDFVGQRMNPYDDNGHGSKMCSLLFGVDTETLCYQGISPEMNYVMLKIADRNGETTYVSFSNAIDWLLENHKEYEIDIVLMPIGFNIPKQLSNNIEKKIQLLSDQGVVFFASSGNDGHSNEVTFPGSVEQVIAVGSIDNSMSGWNVETAIECNFSNSSAVLKKPELVAPGKDILVYNHLLEPEVVSGTSYSAGIAAIHFATYMKIHKDSNIWELLSAPLVKNRVFIGHE